MSKKDDLIFIEHIIDSINAIQDFSKNISKEELRYNRLNQSAIVREIEIIGEAVKNISKETKDKYQEVEWRGIAGTRDKMIHHYFGVDIKIVWDIIKKDIPILEKQMKKIKEGLISSSSSNKP